VITFYSAFQPGDCFTNLTYKYTLKFLLNLKFKAVLKLIILDRALRTQKNEERKNTQK
jgi:hypothetical protein